MADFLLAHPGAAIAGVVVLGVVAQVLAHRLHLPSILLLLLFGFAVSPAGLVGVQPEMFLANDDLFFSLIGAAVAVILFEGGLSLRLSDLQDIGSALWRLITVGVPVAFVLGTGAAWLTLDLPFQLCALLGALLVVTGPTVVMPLLRQVRPTRRVANIAKWEGILNDPIGAAMGVIMLEVIRLEKHGPIVIIAEGIGLTVGVGLLFGLVGAWVLLALFRRHLVPDYLEGVVTLAMVLLAFAGSNLIQHESGLLTVTIMGIILANQRQVSVRHIVEFKEHLGVLFISCLFIILGARLTPEKVEVITGGALAFVALLILVVRPAAVFLSTIGTGLNLRERLFVTWMAPRGIVAAAVAALFALKLTARGVSEAVVLEPVVFVVILGTVSLYGLTAGPLARWLGLADKNPQGLLVVGAQPWARKVALSVQEAGFNVVLIDTNRRHVLGAQAAGLNARQGNILEEASLDELDLEGIGQLLALTPNDEANSLAALHTSDEFGRASVFQLASERTERPDNSKPQFPAHLRGRILWDEEATFGRLRRLLETGGEVRATDLNEEFGWPAFQKEHPDALVLFRVDGKKLEVWTADHKSVPKAGQTVITLIPPTAAAGTVAE